MSSLKVRLCYGLLSIKSAKTPNWQFSVLSGGVPSVTINLKICCLNCCWKLATVYLEVLLFNVLWYREQFKLPMSDRTAGCDPLCYNELDDDKHLKICASCQESTKEKAKRLSSYLEYCFDKDRCMYFMVCFWLVNFFLLFEYNAQFNPLSAWWMSPGVKHIKILS